jgi:Zn-dependent M28 family amino/carboxypeptidase
MLEPARPAEFKPSTTRHRMRLTAGLLAILLIPALVAGWLLLQPLVIPRTSEPPAVDAAALEAHVRALSEKFYPRSFDQLEKLDAAAGYIKSEFLRSGAGVEEQVFAVEEATYRNIIARYGPETGPVLVIGAHYDSFADPQAGEYSAKGYGPESHTPGADDNASGVAALLELGRLLAQSPPPIGVELVAYSVEEPPHFHTGSMGSSWHARHFDKSHRELALMISVEMIGYFSDEPGSQTYPVGLLSWIYPDQGDFIGVVGRVQDWAATRRVKAAMLGATDLPVESINALRMLPGVDFSDHASYWNEGFSALMITDTAQYRNPYYHTAGDTADRLDYQRMAKVVQGLYAVVQRHPGKTE